MTGSGADTNAQRADGQTPAHVSINRDYWYRMTPNSIRNTWAVTGYLLAKGAYYGMTIAAALGDQERVEELLREDPGLSKRLDSGRGSPLYYAARFGYTHVVQLLLDHSADPNLPEDLAPRGRALFGASAGNHLETARLLLERGADPNAEEDSSGSCLTIVDAKHPETCRPMQELLRQYGAVTPPWVLSVEEMKAAFRKGAAVIDHEQFLHELLEKADPELIDVLLKERPDLVRRLTLTDIWGGSCPRDPGSLRKLLDYGFDPNRPNWIGRTFLHRAAERGDIEISRILIEYGADIDAVELEHGGTPLATGAREGQTEMVRFLIERGADPTAPIESPWATPLAWAGKKGHTEVADILRKHGAKA
ncbi:MAG: ankyrin repeat domain-containing protein [Candidatus Latescibacteria bacterium]|nr:ankyrin repeat domain-containing protein [Candidatus Latescibacterota bacterium]